MWRWTMMQNLSWTLKYFWVFKINKWGSSNTLFILKISFHLREIQFQASTIITWLMCNMKNTSTITLKCKIMTPYGLLRTPKSNQLLYPMGCWVTTNQTSLVPCPLSHEVIPKELFLYSKCLSGKTWLNK